MAIQSVLRLRNLGLPPDTVRSAVQLVRNVYRDSSMPHDLLSPAEAHRLWLQYEPGNEKVARRYFPGQESLFVPPVLPTPEEEEEWVQSLPEDDQALKFLFSKAAAAISGKPAPGKPEEKRPARGETPSKREQKRPAVASTAVRHDEQRIVFVHIPKTAGMSLYYALQKWAGEDRSLRYERGTMDDQKQFMQFPVERLDTMKVVSGHFNHSVFRRRCGEAWSYISILRDPVDRFVSMYTYIGGWKGHPFHAQAVNRSFAQFYEWLITSPHNSNTQIKMLTGTENLDDARRVASAYRLIGSVAHMPVFEHELGQLLGKQIEIGAHNQSRKPTTEVVVEPAVREKIEQLNAADRTLYDWVSSERAIVNG